MKAIVRAKYGPPDALQFTEVEKPTPKDNEVLIKVRAASVNPLDLFTMRGAPLIRLVPGLRTPKDKRLGVDVAGQVEAVGRDVTSSNQATKCLACPAEPLPSMRVLLKISWL